MQRMSNSILLVHGDARTRSFAATALRSAGYEVRAIEDLPSAEAGRSDVVVTGWNGSAPFAERLSRIRALEPAGASRVIVMAPREELGVAAELLEDGVDDCIGIPFAPAELLARVKACLRRPAAGASERRLCGGRVVLDRAVHRVLVDDRPIELAPTEFRLLAFFLEHQGRVFSRDELLRRAWSKNIKAGVRTVDVHVRRLRQQLEPFGCANLIQTVRGFGYRFAGQAQAADGALAAPGSA
jgi:two-component system phosphate regulon response regulator PhoB